MAVPRRLRWLPRGNVRTISATNFLAGLYQSALNVVLQPFVLGFGGGLTAVGLLQALSARIGGLVSALVQPVGGYLADARGRRPVAILGSALTIASMALLIAGAAFQREPWALPALVLPGFLCMAAGMVSSPAIQSTIAESAEPRRRVSAYATATFFWVLPGALLAIPLGLASDRLGYGAVFGVALGLESANLVLFARFLRETALRADVHPWRERLAATLRPPPEIRGLFLVVAMDAFAWGLAAGIINGLLKKQFGFSNLELAAIAAGWALSFAAFLPPTAALVNRFGPKRVILFSEALGVPIMLGWLFSSRLEHFLLVSVLNGLTAATWVPVVSTYLTNWTTAERRAGALGSLAAFRGILAFPAPFIGGVLFDTMGYAAPLLANLAGSLAITVAIGFLLKDPPAAGVEVGGAPAP